MSDPNFVHSTYIRTTPEALWAALTDGALTPGYYIAGARLSGDIAAGGRYAYLRADGETMLSGEILAAEPGRRLDMTFEPGWGDGAASRNVYLIEPDGPLCRLTIEHHGLPSSQDGVRDGWVRIAAALKTLLETGAPIATATEDAA